MTIRSPLTMRDFPDLEVPSFLAAMPQVDDPFFHRALVLVLEHGDDGTWGLIVNRPTGLDVREVLDGLEIEWRGEGEEQTFFGGPVQPQRGSILFADVDREACSEQVLEVADGILLTQSSTDLAVLAERPPERFRLILGCAGWGPGQLAEEIGRHDWILLPCEPDLIFADADNDAWGLALTRAGIRPGAISPLRADPSQSLTN